jgi:hypothetical protein
MITWHHGFCVCGEVAHAWRKNMIEERKLLSHFMLAGKQIAGEWARDKIGHSTTSSQLPTFSN